MLVTPYRILPLLDLLKTRNMEDQIAEIPSFGLLAYDKGKVVAGGFLRKVEGDYAMLDSYITDPDAAPEIRDKALDMITEKLIRISRLSGVRKLLVFTADKNTYYRSLGLNFTPLPHKFSVLSLK